MTVSPDSPLRTDYKGTTYFFCAPGCLQRFTAEPERYLAPQATAPPTMAELDAIYTCPMHPEVRSATPGKCPKCGMTLVPEAKP